MESSILIILTGKNTRHSSFFSARFWGSISTILPHSFSPSQPRKTTISPYPLRWIIVYRSHSSLPNFKQISIPPVFRERLPKLSHCMSAFCDLLPYTCVSLMRHAVQRCCATRMRSFLQIFSDPLIERREIQEHISGSCIFFVPFSDLTYISVERSSQDNKLAQCLLT